MSGRTVGGALRAPREAGPVLGPPDRASVAALRDRVRAFATEFRTTVERWSGIVREAVGGGDVVLWGAGAKGVTFLNLLPEDLGVSLVVDRNPRKHGKYVPGTGQEIVAPEALRGRSVGIVIVMNRIYEDEVRAELADLDVTAKIVSV